MSAGKRPLPGRDSVDREQRQISDLVGEWLAIEVEHVQDFQFWRVALRRTHYNDCHIQVFSFPCYGH